MGTTAVAFRDLGGSLLRLPLAFWLAWDDIHGKYRRTVLGPLWITLGQAAVICGFAVVFSGLFQQDPLRYLLYLAAGLPIWVLTSSFLTDMPNVFVNARGVIESYELPWLMQIWRRAFGYLLVFFHHIVTLLAAMAILNGMGHPVMPTVNMLYVFPALGILLFAGVGFGLFVAVLGARFRDLQHALAMSAGFLMLFTPVLWRADQLQNNEWVYQYNPLYYFIRLVRDPLLQEMPPPEIWIGAGAGAFALFILGFVTFWLGRRNLYHWM